MGAGISFFRWNRKQRLITLEPLRQVSEVIPPVSAAESHSPDGSPIVQVVDNVFEVRDVTNEQFHDHIMPNGLTLITENLSLQSPNKYQLLNMVEITPRADEDMQSGVPDTPIGFEASVYKYYCPLCMLHFKRILKTKCCNNYICLACCMDYLSSKGVERKENITDTLANAQWKLEKLHCPNCSTLGFQPFPVALDDLVRDYSRDNADQKLISLKTSIPNYYQASPVRRGESFEDLKRKMIPYGSARVVGIADVVSPVTNITINSDDDNKRNQQTRPHEEHETEGIEEPVVVRRLDFDDIAPNTEDNNNNNSNDNDEYKTNESKPTDSARARSERVGQSVSVNVLATSVVNYIFEQAVHK